MSPFGRRQNTERSPEERERARLEREARRAAREGRPIPQPPPAPVADEPAWDDVPADAHDGGNGAAAPVEAEPRWEEPPVAEEPPAPAPAEPTVPDAASRSAWDDTGAWDPHPPAEAPGPAAGEPEAPAPEPAAAAEETHAWDDTGAWDAHPPAADAPAPDAPADPAPTLGDEIRSVDRGWFEDEEPTRTSQEPGQETVEWDVLQNRPKDPVVPADQPQGLDSPTVEFDVLANRPKAPVPDPPAAPPQRASFPDADERPVPTRRVSGAARQPAGGHARRLPPPPPPPGERTKRRGPGKGTFLAIFALLLVAVALYLVNAVFQPLADEGTGSVRVTIPQNSSAGDVGDVLEREGVVDSAFFFEVRARLDGAKLQAGNFTLKQGMPYGDAIDALAKQPEAPPTVNVTIPEGRARRETAPIVEKAGLRGSYLQASERVSGFSPRKYGAPKSVKSLEGFLFPATYELRPNATSRQLVKLQVEAFERNIADVSMRRARRRNLSTYDVLTIASMVEREATLARERRIIAAVIHNRLREGMPLGIDATIRYATRNWSRPLRQSELDIDSPYNTRRRTGLPPTPIGSPGLASIKAAANPANVDYLYYVVKPGGDGAHNFSSTDAEFQRDVEAYNRERERRGGKDPSSSDGG